MEVKGNQKHTLKFLNLSTWKENEHQKSKAFIMGGYDWFVTMARHTQAEPIIACYIIVPAGKNKPHDWRRNVDFSVKLVNQAGRGYPDLIKSRNDYVFQKAAKGYYWHDTLGGEKFLTDNGFVVDETLEIEVSIDVRSATSPIHTPKTSWSMSLGVSDALTISTGPHIQLEVPAPAPLLPSLEEAKTSVLECLSHPMFQLGMKDTLLSALNTTMSETPGDRESLFTAEQWELLRDFHGGYSSFIESFEHFEKTFWDFVVTSCEAGEKVEPEKEKLKEILATPRKRKLVDEVGAWASSSEVFAVQATRLMEAREAKKQAKERKVESILKWYKLRKLFS